MKARHRLLERQLRKHFGGLPPEVPGLAAFIAAVDEAYLQQDAQRQLTDRAMNLSSAELCEAMARLQSRSARDQEVLGQLRAAIRSLNLGTGGSEEDHGDILALVSQLETLIRERNAHHAELQTAKEAAEQASRAKSEFLANMSHEIRTPLNAIVGFTTLLVDQPDRARQRDYVARIQHGAQHLLAIVSDILDLSKIEAGKLEIEPRAFSLCGDLHDSLEFFQAEAARKGVTLTFTCDPAVPCRIVSDPTRVRQVLVNLIGNALKFTERGTVAVSVRGEPLGDGRWRLHFAVADTGIGIPADRLDRLFRNFSQVDASTVRRYGGTGLGLAICKRLVELMGGSVGVRSEPGRGSEFSFNIVVEEAGATASPFPPPGERGEDLSALRILIADDNPANRRLLEMMLETCGCRAEFVEDGSAALAALARDPFDLVLLDQQMPKLAGLEVVSRFRAEPGPHPGPLIALLTAHYSPADRKAGSALEVHDFLTKPLALADLRGVLARAAFGRTARLAAGAAPHA